MIDLTNMQEFIQLNDTIKLTLPKPNEIYLARCNNRLKQKKNYLKMI